jgi:predicted RNA-binding protein (virulence factor B family)
VLNLGIDKDVFVPKKEQKHPMDLGEKYVVYIYLDDHANRLLASSRLNNFIGELDADLEEGDEVALLISEKTDLGYNAVINNRHIGLLYHNEIYETLQPGDKRRGYIKKIREENKIDLSLQPIGFDHILQLRNSLVQVIKDNNGVLPLGDKSSPEEIQQKLKISKKAFKKAIGGLYKERLITLSDHEIRLVQP